MKKSYLLVALGCTVSALALAAPASAQSVPPPGGEEGAGNIDGQAGADAQTSGDAPSAVTEDGGATDTAGGDDSDIIVTAQRRAEVLQNVPIAVSAFTGEALERQQIENSSDLQLTLPNITYTKTNFTSSSFTIRGIGDLCVGATCDSATAIHVNDMPLVSTRLFETEFYDMARIEVLRGPQGTLFGRNATSGVVNLITARPDLSGFHASAEAEYGNYNSMKAKGMINLPVGDTIGVRLAGIYVKRDGYTHNLYTGNDIDGRDLYSVRGTLSWEPSADTRIDLIGYYFREKDDRSRIQKQLCHRDPTGVLGCLPDKLAFETPNGNSTLAAVLTSRELFTLSSPALAPFALQSLYGPDTYAGVVNPADLRTVNIDFEPTYFAKEQHLMLKVSQNMGAFGLNVTAGYAKNQVDSRTDYNLAVENSLATNPGLLTLNAAGKIGGPAPFLNGVRQTLIPNGPGGGVCQSDADPNNVGVYGGNSIGCFAQSLDFDRSRARTRQYVAEAHVDSNFDGMFNFLVGGIYLDSQTRNNDYFVNAFGLDYAAGILGAASSAAIPGVNGNAFLATPFYRSDTDTFRLKSYGVFGETYFELSDALKVTLGLRYNHDDKFVRARNLTLNVLTPIGSDNITDGLNYKAVDFDPTTPGIQEYAVREVAFSRLTGRAVIDYRITPDNMVYASYSRGYKSGGINPPLPPIFAVATTFAPEKVDAFEIGSKNTFGPLRLNLTGFYYKYSGLQLSRIVARTSVNDNVSAEIWGVEAEAVVQPVRGFLVNMNASYLNTKVSSDKFLVNPRDPSGGRADAVIIKDIQNGSNCVVVANNGNAAFSNGFVTAVNAGTGASVGQPGLLKPPTPIPGMGGTTGAFGVCSALTAASANPAFGVSVLDGVPVNIRGNELPQAPNVKFSAGAQYTIGMGSMSIVPRIDITYTGESYGSVFNGNINRIEGYEVVNAQIQFNGPDERWYARAFVQNLTGNDAITGLYVTDQSSGLFTNVFTLEPRRYGIAAGIKF
jgi:outer membrane receptor protein involved in Fe transport